jgi:hypothetical protein
VKAVEMTAGVTQNTEELKKASGGSIDALEEL